MARLIWLLGLPVHLIKRKQWQYPVPGFQDDPFTFKKSDLWFFGYRYYFKTLEKAEENSGHEAYFAKQDFSFAGKEAGATTITLSAGGDLMPYAWITPQSAQNLWDEAGDFFFNSDIVFANLETPFDVSQPPSSTPEIMLYNVYFNGDEKLFGIFSGNGKYRGYDVLSTANNHALDKGEEGLRATLDFLDAKKIKSVGTARTGEERDNFPIVERSGIKVAFLAYTYSLNTFQPLPGKEYMTNYLQLNLPGVDIGFIARQAKQARQRGADFVVCSVHAGCAYQAYPSNHTVDVFHRIFEQAGVDVILGHHPHNPQPMEQYTFADPFTGKQKKGFAIYSLGDFVAYDLNIYCRMPLMLKFDITKNSEATQLTGLQILPAYMAGKKEAGQFKLQLLHLERLAKQNFNHPFLDAELKKEATELHRLLRSHILPGQHEKWIV